MKQYVNLLTKILTEGEDRIDRTGVGTRAIFGGQIEFDLRESFPLVTVKLTRWEKAFIEMLWFLRGEPNTKYLKEHNVGIWDDWADADGNLGPIYGVQWRKWQRAIIKNHYADQTVDHSDGSQTLFGATVNYIEIDQIKQLIHMIKTNPTGRRHIVTAWNPAFIENMGLPPCHRDFQCYVTNDGQLDLMMSQRSWDTGLGAPFNIAQYGMLTHLIARATNLTPRRLIINYGDAHIYTNHIEKLTEVVKLPPKECKTKLIINTDNTDIDGYKIEDFAIEGYESHPFVKLPIAV